MFVIAASVTQLYMYLKHGKASTNASHDMMMMMMMTTAKIPTDQGPTGQERGGLALPRFDLVAVAGAHLLGAIVLDERVEWYHPVDFQQHRRGAQLLLAWSAAEVAGGWAAAFLLTADLHTRDELVVRKHLRRQQT